MPFKCPTERERVETLEKVRLNKPCVADLAWFAGLFDGEGCISLVKPNLNLKHPRKTYHLRISIGMTHLPTIQKVHNIWQLGQVYCYSAGKVASASVGRAEWGVTTRQALHVLETVLPFLVTKREEAEVAIAFQKCKRNRGRRLTVVEILQQRKLILGLEISRVKSKLTCGPKNWRSHALV